MKNGLHVGNNAVTEVKVTPDMFAQFAGEVVHPVISTASMVYYMEWTSRKIILPYLEDHEEGMGGEVHVKHIAPSIENSTVVFSATVKEYRKNKVVTNVIAKNEKGIIGEGEVTQVILPKQRINSLLS